MPQPPLTTFNTIAPLVVQTYERYLPTAFDESMSLLEKVNKIIRKLDEIGVISNELIVQWNKVIEWILAEGINETVGSYLDELVENGTMDEIVNEHVLAQKLDASVFNQKIDYVSVKDFGAIGDGVADDSEAIQKAVDYAMKTMFNILSTKYAMSFRLIFPSGRYRTTKAITVTKPDNAVSTLTGRNPELIIEGAGRISSTWETTEADFLIDAYEISLTIQDMGLWNTTGTVLRAGRNESTYLKELRQAQFNRVFFRGNKCLRIERMFDSSFYDCFMALSGTSGIGIEVVSPQIDNTNNVNFHRLHMENGSPNGTFFKCYGRPEASGYHHGLNFDGCHFETRDYSMKVLDIKNVASFSFKRCQFTQNANPNIGDSVYNSVNMILLENVSTITFDTCTMQRTGDIASMPLLVKASGFCNAVTFRNVQATTCGDGTGGRANLIDDSLCTTKRGIVVENCILTSYTNKASHNDRLFISQPKLHNRDWQLFTENQHLYAGYTSDPAKDLLMATDAGFGFSTGGQFMAKYGVVGKTANIANGSTFSFTVPTTVSSNGRALYLFNVSEPNGIYFGILSVTEQACVSVILGSGVTNGGTTAPSDAGKMNVWLDTATKNVNFKNLIGSARDIAITPFAFGSAF